MTSAYITKLNLAKKKYDRDKTQKKFSINYINHKLEVTY